MSEGDAASGRVIESVDELTIGDGLYSEASGSPYWVTEITDTKVMLRDKSDAPHVWVRDTFEASLDAHTWIHQSGVASRTRLPSRDGASDP